MLISLTKPDKWEDYKQKRRNFERNNINQLFMVWLNQQGMFNNYFDVIPREDVLVGRIPEGFCVHHVVPLFGNGDNELSNMVFMDCKLHNLIHRYFYDDYVPFVQKDMKLMIRVPDFKPVSLYRDFGMEILEAIAERSDYLYHCLQQSHSIEEWAKLHRQVEKFMENEVPLFWENFLPRAPQLVRLKYLNELKNPQNEFEKLLFKFGKIFDAAPQTVAA